MKNLTHRYCFPEISNSSRRFQGTIYRDGTCYEPLVSVSDYQFLKTGRSVPGLAADIIDLAVAVSAADRLSICKDDVPNVIEIVLPVRNPDLFGKCLNLELLKDVLYWYTGDDWFFSFTKRGSEKRVSELQQCLPLDSTENPVEVALWSGGLDAFAGLYNRLSVSASKQFTLLGTGSSSIVHKCQKETMLALGDVPSFVGRTNLIRVPIRIKRTVHLPKNNELRTRGFVFLLLGAVCAHLEGKDELKVYENGIGAINLPYRRSELGLDHARSVHPVSLLKMETLVSNLLDKAFRFDNPFMFHTKAQMCERLVKDGKVEMIRKTISCDRLRRERPMQCGLCSSCLLRRQSLAVFGLEDKNDYVATTPRTNTKTDYVHDAVHLRAMLCQVENLNALLSSGKAWEILSRCYSTLTDIVDRTAQRQPLAQRTIQDKLLGLYRSYVSEWSAVRSGIASHWTEN